MIRFRGLLEKSRAYSLIKRDVQENMVSHAYMILSEDNVALEEFYTLFLEAVFCKNNACGTCAECRKIEGRNHADITHIEKEKNLQVEDIKRIIEESYVSTVEGGKKAFVIHQGDKMTKQAQNKLLKILEEPPENVMIIIGVNNESKILQTVKSRAKKIGLDLFDSKDIYGEICHFTDDTEKAMTAADCSDGLIGKALSLIDNERYLSLYDESLNILNSLTHSSQIVNYLPQKALNKENLGDTLDIMMMILRDVAVGNKAENLVQNKHKIDEIRALSTKFSVASAIGIIERIEKFKKMLYYNINSSNVAEQLLFAILEVKFKCN